MSDWYDYGYCDYCDRYNDCEHRVKNCKKKTQDDWTLADWARYFGAIVHSPEL